MAMTFNTYARNNETRKYVKRIKNAGKTLDAFSVLDIDNFVTGCKDLGIWNNMVCWPLRSTQNTGTNTAFSLGGLGTFDGSLVNGPTWGVDGVNFSKSSIQWIETSLRPTANNHGIFVCSDWSQVTEASNLPIGTRNVYNDVSAAIGLAIGTVATPPTGVRLTSSDGIVWGEQHLSSGMPTNFACFSMLSDGSKLTINRNEVQQSLHSVVNGQAYSALNIGAGGYDWQGTYNGRVAFALAIYAPANNADIYALYKTTLGKGLGLP